ncbi:hypothetical protein RM543_15865 [Roseicyclus sp. F158]|uniref:Uncharacterized protein n=1 Tax=Tropicimonas omnivorans TaxID=3075590 RepID=A0ABU3DM20_9RHOB|nr:hypothetical protein [Roseicyclus sp. F158]MDT0684162.1 hypothetical protein [Roseicyclus sp. F158]
MLTLKSGHFTFDIFDNQPVLVEEIAKAYGMWLLLPSMESSCRLRFGRQ